MSDTLQLLKILSKNQTNKKKQPTGLLKPTTTSKADTIKPWKYPKNFHNLTNQLYVCTGHFSSIWVHWNVSIVLHCWASPRSHLHLLPISTGGTFARFLHNSRALRTQMATAHMLAAPPLQLPLEMMAAGRSRGMAPHFYPLFSPSSSYSKGRWHCLGVTNSFGLVC